MTFYSLFPSQQFFPQSYFNSKNAAGHQQQSSNDGASPRGGSTSPHHSNRNSSVSHGRLTMGHGAQHQHVSTVLPPSRQVFVNSQQDTESHLHPTNAYPQVPPPQVALSSHVNKHLSTDSTNSVTSVGSSSSHQMAAHHHARHHQTMVPNPADFAAPQQQRSSADLSQASNTLNLIEKLELWNLNSKNKRDSTGSISSARSSLSLDESWTGTSYSGNTSGSASEVTGNRLSNSSVTSVLSDVNPYMMRGNRSSLDSNASIDYLMPPGPSSHNSSFEQISPRSLGPSASYSAFSHPDSGLTSSRLSREFDELHTADFYITDAHFVSPTGGIPPPTTGESFNTLPRHMMPHPSSHYTPPTPRSTAVAGGIPQSWNSNQTPDLYNATSKRSSTDLSSHSQSSSARSSMDFSSSNRIYDNTNVFVKHLPPFVDDDQLRSYFQPFGEIISCKVMLNVKTGASLGFGFVRFQDSVSAQQAIDKMTGYRIGKKKLLCKLSNKALPQHSVIEPRSNLYVKHLPVSYDNQKLRTLFERFGKIKEVKVMMDKHTGLSKQIGFVRFERQVDATTALQELNNILLDEDGSVTPLNIHYAETSTEKRMRQVQQQARLSISQQFLANQQGSGKIEGGTVTHSAMSEPAAVVPFSTTPDDPTPIAVEAPNPESDPESPSRLLSSPPTPVEMTIPKKSSTMPLTSHTDTHDALSALVKKRRSTGESGSTTTSGSTPSPVSAGGKADDQKANLFIFHLPQDITDSELYTLFSPFGAVESVRVILDLNGQSRGFGFVKYVEFSDALQAITAMNGFKLGKKHIKVSFKQ